MECTACFALVPYDGAENLLVVRKGVIVTEDVFRLYVIVLNVGSPFACDPTYNARMPGSLNSVT